MRYEEWHDTYDRMRDYEFQRLLSELHDAIRQKDQQLARLREENTRLDKRNHILEEEKRELLGQIRQLEEDLARRKGENNIKGVKKI